MPTSGSRRPRARAERAADRRSHGRWPRTRKAPALRTSSMHFGLSYGRHYARARAGVGTAPRAFSQSWKEDAMKRVLLATVAASLSTSALGESYVGAWSAGSSVGLPRCSQDDDNKIILKADSETGYEHYCRFVRKQQTSANTWQVTASCSGEGGRRSAIYTLTVQGNRLIHRSPNGTGVYRRCGGR